MSLVIAWLAGVGMVVCCLVFCERIRKLKADNRFVLRRLGTAERCWDGQRRHTARLVRENIDLKERLKISQARRGTVEDDLADCTKVLIRIHLAEENESTLPLIRLARETLSDREMDTDQKERVETRENRLQTVEDDLKVCIETLEKLAMGDPENYYCHLARETLAKLATHTEPEPDA